MIGDSLSTIYVAKTIVLQENSFLRETESGDLNKNQKEVFLTGFATAIKEDPHKRQ